MTSMPFQRTGGWCAILVAMLGFLCATAFFAINRVAPGLGVFLSALFLMANGLLATAVEVTLYNRLRRVDSAWALLALVLGLAGAIGGVVHAGYDLANAIHPLSLPRDLAELPSPIDPRGCSPSASPASRSPSSPT